MTAELDLEALEARVKLLVEAEDLEGIVVLDEELRSYLGFEEGEGVGQSNVESVGAKDLARLNELYQLLGRYATGLKDSLAGEIRGMKANKKGINAYRTSD